jgi:adenine phosphoribosyltransferase
MVTITRTDSNNSGSNLTALDYRPSLIFDNDTTGKEAAKRFAEHYLLPFVHEDLQRLANMVRQVPNFPRPGIEFRHVLGISQQPGGLALCTSLLQTHFTGDWAKVDAVVCCEAGGFVYASALALRVDVPLVLIREAGKLPPPTVSVIKPPSHISSLASNNSKEKRIEMERDVVPRGASVVVVDDVLSTGETLCAVLQLLEKLASVPRMSASWSWPSSRFTVAGNCCAGVGLAESIFKAFWSLAVLRKGRKGSRNLGLDTLDSLLSITFYNPKGRPCKPALSLLFLVFLVPQRHSLR